MLAGRARIAFPVLERMVMRRGTRAALKVDTHGGVSEAFFGDGILIEPGEVARIVCRGFPPACQTAQRKDFAKVST